MRLIIGAILGTALLAILWVIPAQLAQTIGILGSMLFIAILAMFPDHI